MADNIATALISVAGALIGTGITAYISIEYKQRQKLLARIKLLKAEIRARQAEEDVACEWLVEQGIEKSAISAKKRLRQRTYQKRGIRPFMSPTQVQDDG